MCAHVCVLVLCVCGSVSVRGFGSSSRKLERLTPSFTLLPCIAVSYHSAMAAEGSGDRDFESAPESEEVLATLLDQGIQGFPMLAEFDDPPDVWD